MKEMEMSIANTNLYRLCRVVVPTNRSISLLSHRGVQQRLPTSITNLLDVTIASVVWSKSTLVDRSTRLHHYTAKNSFKHGLVTTVVSTYVEIVSIYPLSLYV